MFGELFVFAIIVALFAIVGVRVGMLVGRRLGRMSEEDEEVDGGHH